MLVEKGFPKAKAEQRFQLVVIDVLPEAAVVAKGKRYDAER